MIYPNTIINELSDIWNVFPFYGLPIKSRSIYRFHFVIFDTRIRKH